MIKKGILAQKNENVDILHLNTFIFFTYFQEIMTLKRLVLLWCHLRIITGSYIHSFIHVFTFSFMHEFTICFSADICTFTIGLPLFICLSIHSFNHLCAFILVFIDVFVYTYTYYCISFINSLFIHSFVHS